MTAEWLRRGASDRLILVLSGWAVGAAPFRHLSGDADVLVLSDWRRLVMPDLPGHYAHVDLVAYSFGVGAAPFLKLPPGRRVAVCGSWRACDDALGIPRATLAATEAGLDGAALARFARRAGVPLPEGGDLAALRQELRAVMAWDAKAAPHFDRVVIGARDRIFPLAHLQAAWPGAEVMDCGHNPFALWRDWSQVLP